MKILPATSLNGSIRLPGDKSISHRAAMLAAMAVGQTRIHNFAASVDCGSTLECLEAVGVKIIRSGTTVTVSGVGKSGFLAPTRSLDCGNSGTTMRLLAGILAGQSFDSELTGDDGLRRRPMKRIVGPLERMGARVSTDDGHAPVKISAGGSLHAIDEKMQIASAQIKSCILLAGLNAAGTTSVVEPTTTRDHTERMLRWFGVEIGEAALPQGKRITVSGDQTLRARALEVPGDISSAAFFLVAAACLPGSSLVLENVGLNPTRSAIIDVLSQMGAGIQVTNKRELCNEPVGDIKLSGGLAAVSERAFLKGSVIANLIDEIPILAILGTQLEGGIEIRDAGELRVKESDRIAALVKNLRAMNATIEEFPDGIRVSRSRLSGATIDSFGDHRIAMAFAIAGLMAEGETRIDGADCADISYPGFFDTLAGVVR